MRFEMGYGSVGGLYEYAGEVAFFRWFGIGCTVCSTRERLGVLLCYLIFGVFHLLSFISVYWF